MASGCAIALLAGCGSSTRFVTATNPPQPLAASATSTTTSSSAATTEISTASRAISTVRPANNTGGTPAPAESRTESAPGFVEGHESSAQLASADAAVRGKGYVPTSTSAYVIAHALRVIIGTRTSAGGVRQQQAFFFLGERFLGTDSATPSGSIDVAGSADGEATLAYALFRPADPACCASGGRAMVRFVLNNGVLQPASPIPPAAQRR